MNQPIRVVLDSNVYISGIVFGGSAAIILAAAIEGSFALCVSDSLKAEVETTLREKFQWDDEDIASACQPLWDRALHVAPTGRLSIVAADPDDDRILECAVAAGAELLVTGDKHFLKLTDEDLKGVDFKRAQIVTPKEFLDYGLFFYG